MKKLSSTHRRLCALRNRRHQRRGVMVVLFAVCLPVLLILSAFCINLAYMELTRTELRVATDATARAAGRRLALSGNTSMAIAEGKEAASRNLVAGQAFSLADSDFEFGKSVRTGAARYGFDPATSSVNAVRVEGKRTAGSVAGAAPLFFSRILGIDDFEATQNGTSTQVELDIAIVLDRSGSMAYADDEATPTTVYYPPASAQADWEFGDEAPPDARWRDTVAGVQAFLSELNSSPQQEQISLTTYSDNATVDLELTTDHSEVMEALDDRTESFDSGATNIGSGIEAGLNTLSSGPARPWAAKVVIVLTDGNHNTGKDPESASAEAASQGVAVFTITFSDEASQGRMESAARKGKGQHFHASSASDLIMAFREVANTLPTLLTE